VSAHSSKGSGRTGDGGLFEDTLWSRVIAAGKTQLPDSRNALEELCQTYWLPIYAFLRRWGHDRQDARDLTQGFFAYVLEQKLLVKADPDRGRFRSFLLGILKNFVSNQRDWEAALKRGSQYRIVSMDEQTAEGLYAHEPATDSTPEKMFDRRWALKVLEQAMERLREEYRPAGMNAFELLKRLVFWVTRASMNSENDK
jgi:RNA polymerase sigma factor (sigma-70 family)